jgi:hypothetical protein
MANREIWIMGARIAFAPGIFEASPPANDPKGKAKFNCGLIIPGTDTKQIAKIEAIELELCEEHDWKDKSDGTAMHKLLAKKDKLALHDGDDKPKYEGFPGNRYLSPSSDAKPTVMHGRTREPIGKTDGTVYSGCVVNAKVELWVQDNQWGQRVNATLLGVQYVKDGDAFGAGATPANPDDFPDLAVEEGAEDPFA